eukprot:CAMPEP_0197486810 /NCGR_PEP_ID=MMETSP1311-20131121/1799_1 /TAXON_ID=464262 /ORGANISM="Genus nov. species nov., Strain RCC856" /LENGTH=93 /DNA_ID=CAMNT_0043030125 /DNA_START=19 /DNA_END=297 /DNA_ORIENTATION=+
MPLTPPPSAEGTDSKIGKGGGGSRLKHVRDAIVRFKGRKALRGGGGPAPANAREEEKREGDAPCSRPRERGESEETERGGVTCARNHELITGK